MSGGGEDRVSDGVRVSNGGGSEVLAEEDSGHSTGLRVGGGVEEVGEFEGEGVRVGLFDEVEEGFSVGALLVGGGHELAYQGFEGGWVCAKYGTYLCHLDRHRPKEPRMRNTKRIGDWRPPPPLSRSGSLSISTCYVSVCSIKFRIEREREERREVLESGGF